VSDASGREQRERNATRTIAGTASRWLRLPEPSSSQAWQVPALRDAGTACGAAAPAGGTASGLRRGPVDLLLAFRVRPAIMRQPTIPRIAGGPDVMSERIRILLADDHPVVLDGLAAVLGTQPDFEVAGQAGSGAEALELAARLRPDVVLLDLEMPQMDGVEVLRRLLQLQPTPRVLVFTAFDTDDHILAAVRAGAQGYLLKGTPRQQLFEAVRVVHAGGSLLQPVVAEKLLRQVREVAAAPPPAQHDALTARELEVLRLLARGLPNKQIALKLDVTERTVKFHVGQILQKLDAANRTEAVAAAAQRGLVQL
jgi:DNA-binding NarL/FixJ family response regulator